MSPVGSSVSFSVCLLTRIHPNLKSTVYCSAIAFGGVEEWDFAWEMFKNATLASEASRLRAAMSCTKVLWLLNRYVQHRALFILQFIGQRRKRARTFAINIQTTSYTT